MRIVVTSHNFGAGAVPSGTLGRDLLHSWLGSRERSILAGMEIEYIFRGYASYRLSGPIGGIDHWIDFVLAIDETDFDLVKIALGRVRLYIPEPDDEIFDITDADFRARLRMTLDECEDWEIDLSNPPKKTTIITHNK